MHQRTALDAWEDDALQLLLDLLAGALRQDDAATRAAQRLVGGRGDHVRVRQRVRIDAGGDQARDMRHVDEQVGAHLVGDGAEARPVHHLRIGGEAGHDHLRLVLQGQPFDFVVIDQALVVHAVLDGVEELARGVDLGAVGQVAAVGQAHAQDGVAGAQQGEVHGLVGLRTGMRLHVGVVGAEQLLDAVDRQLFGDVHVFAAAVVALARVAFGVLVGELAALRFHHQRACVVFRRDQLDMVFLAAVLVGDGLGQFGVETFNACVAREHRLSGVRGDWGGRPQAGLAEPPIVRAGADARPQAMRRKAASAAPR